MYGDDIGDKVMSGGVVVRGYGKGDGGGVGHFVEKRGWKRGFLDLR